MQHLRYASFGRSIFECEIDGHQRYGSAKVSTHGWGSTSIAHARVLQLSVKNCFIRGSVVRYIQLPADEVDLQLLQDSTRKELAQNKAAR
jgi:hypothetical protein